VVEVAAQRLLAGETPAAEEAFESVLKMDELNMPAVLGLIEVHLASDRLEEAEQQLSFLPELLAASKASGALGSQSLTLTSSNFKSCFGFGSCIWRLSNEQAKSRRRSRPSATDEADGAAFQVIAGSNSELQAVHEDEPLLLYLKGLLAWKQGKQQEGLLQLQQFVEQQLESVDDLPFGLELIVALNISRFFRLLHTLLLSVGGDPRLPSDPPSPVLGLCMR
jgi:tetratricopeptide repeat protein 21B